MKKIIVVVVFTTQMFAENSIPLCKKQQEYCGPYIEADECKHCCSEKFPNQEKECLTWCSETYPLR